MFSLSLSLRDKPILVVYTKADAGVVVNENRSTIYSISVLFFYGLKTNSHAYISMLYFSEQVKN